VRDASMPGRGTAPLQLPGTANIGMPQRSLLDRPCSPPSHRVECDER
jgi:hypothetical protein